jgi:gliding motility-associated lipoprotein GldH
MRLTSSFLFLLVAVCLISCDKKRVFDDYKSVGTAWEKDSIVTFNFKQEDTTKLYNLFVNLRANQAYQFNNLYVIVAMERPGGLTKVDTLQYQMTNPDGSLLGNGWSDIKESKLFYKENLRFDTVGDYKVKIQQAVRQTGKIEGIKALDGITEVGFRIETTE